MVCWRLVLVGIMVMPADLRCGFPCGGGLPSSLMGVRLPLFGLVLISCFGFCRCCLLVGFAVAV